MTTPGPPQIRIRPKVTSQTLEFFWQPPVSDGGDPITSYVLTDGGAFSNDIGAPATYFKQTGLINKTPYTFTIQASNSFGLGEVATFRTVQSGLLPPNPDYLSIYRISETSAKLSWNNPVTDSDTPDSLRNVIVTPAVDANGKYPYPGDNSVTSSAVRLFGDISNSFVSVAVDASYNFIVRAQNDPGYSGAYNGTGVFSLKDVPYTGDVIVNAVIDTPTYQNTINYSIVKDFIGPLQNYNTSRSQYSRWGIVLNQRGFIGQDDIGGTGLNIRYTVLNKNGFALFNTPNNLGDNFVGSETITNPVAVLLPLHSQGGISSNLTMYAYDYSNNTHASTIFTKSGGALFTQLANNTRNTNAYFRIGDSNASPITYDHYTIPVNSKTPVKRYTSADIPMDGLYRVDRSLHVLMKEPTNATYAYILYVPNTGSHILYDISGQGITSFTTGSAISSGKVLVYGATSTPLSNIYTFTLTGTPSTQVRQVSGNSYNFIMSRTMDSYSDSIFNGFTTNTASFVDISGDGLRYAISPVVTEPALVYSGATQTPTSNVQSATLTGEVYYTDSGNYHFTGVASDGSGCTVQFKYGASATPITTSFTYTNAKSYPFYSIHTYASGNINPIIILSYSTQLDMSGADISGATLVSSSDNSGVNFISVSGWSVGSYIIGLNHFPPTRLANYFATWTSTFPSNNYTIGRIDGGDIFHIYNGDTFDVSGTIGFVPDAVFKGPDCWYFAYYGGGASISITRIATNGAKVTGSFVFNHNSTLELIRTPTSVSFTIQNTGTSQYVFIIYTTTTNIFELKSYNSNRLLGSTWTPDIILNYI